MDEHAEKTARITKNVVDAVIKVAILAILVVWAFNLIKPFLIPVIWGVILAVAMEPFIEKVAKMLGGRKALASGLFVLVVIAAIVIPTVVLVGSSIDTTQTLIDTVQDEGLVVPSPPPAVAEWPIIGDKVHRVWQQASTNLAAVVKHYAPEIKTAATTFLSSVGGGILGLFMVIISTCIAGVFMAKSEKCAQVAQRVITRVAGAQGAEITSLATATIRGVMQGVVGVAVIQAIMSTAGMLVVGVPASGLWGALVLVCAVGQLPPILVLGPVAAYVFSVADTTPAVLFLVWALFVSASDGFLKPMLMGRGVDIPMLVILIGALGGMMLSGIIGLFVGAVVLAIMYTLFMEWIDDQEDESTSET